MSVQGYVPRRVRRKEDLRREAQEVQAAKDLKNGAEAARLAGITELEAALAKHIEVLGKLPDCVIEMQSDSQSLPLGTRLRHRLTPSRPGHHLLAIQHHCFALSEDGVLYQGYVAHQPAGMAFTAMCKFAEFDRHFPDSGKASARALKRLLAED